MVKSVGTSYNLANQLRQLQNARKKFEDTTNKITSQYQAQDFNELTKTNKLSKYSELQKNFNSTKDYINNIDLAKSNLETIDISLNNMIEISSDMISLAVHSLSTDRKFLQITSLCKNALSNVENNLNAQSINGYIFSGTMANTKPTNDLANNSNLINNQISYNYYKGNFALINIKASDALTINYGITGNHIAFQKLIGGVNQLIKTDGTNDISTVQQAQETLNQALQTLNQLRVNNRNNLKALENAKNNHMLTLLNIQEQLSDLVVTDQIDAATQLAIDEQNLKAAYHAYPQLLNNNLADYLR